MSRNPRVCAVFIDVGEAEAGVRSGRNARRGMLYSSSTSTENCRNSIKYARCEAALPRTCCQAASRWPFLKLFYSRITCVHAERKVYEVIGAK